MVMGKGNVWIKFALGFIGIYVGLLMLVETLPLLFIGFQNLSAVAGLSFASFFATGGIVFLIVSVVILTMIFKSIGAGKGGLGK